MNKIDKIHELLNNAFIYAKQAHERCYHNLDTDVPPDYRLALSLAASCTSYYAAAAAIYLGDPDWDDESITAILRQFEIVTREIQTVYGQTRRNLTALHIELDYLEKLLCDNGYAL